MQEDFDFTTRTASEGLQARLDALDANRPADLEARVYDGGVEVTHLVVSGPARDRGVARRLIESVIDETRAARGAGADVDEVVVTTQGGDPAAHLLRDMGFSVRREQVDSTDDMVTRTLVL